MASGRPGCKQRRSQKAISSFRQVVLILPFHTTTPESLRSRRGFSYYKTLNPSQPATIFAGQAPCPAADPPVGLDRPAHLTFWLRLCRPVRRPVLAVPRGLRPTNRDENPPEHSQRVFN